MMRKPPTNPQIGEMIMGRITLKTTPLPSHQWRPDGWYQITAFQSPCEVARAAPHNPPTNAWLELEGRPNHQVRRFQMIAPINAQRTVWRPTKSASRSPDEI